MRDLILGIMTVVILALIVFFGVRSLKGVPVSAQQPLPSFVEKFQDGDVTCYTYRLPLAESVAMSCVR